MEEKELKQYKIGEHVRVKEHMEIGEHSGIHFTAHMAAMEGKEYKILDVGTHRGRIKLLVNDPELEYDVIFLTAPMVTHPQCRGITINGERCKRIAPHGVCPYHENQFFHCYTCNRPLLKKNMQQFCKKNGKIFCSADCAAEHDYGECTSCAKLMEKRELKEVDGYYLCEQCYANLKSCDRCGISTTESLRTVHTKEGEKKYCSECAWKKAFECEECGKFFAEDLIENTNGRHFCKKCYAGLNFYRCSLCKEKKLKEYLAFYNSGSNEDIWAGKTQRIKRLCRDCTKEVNPDVKEYSYRPKFRFYDQTGRYEMDPHPKKAYFGVELETHFGSERGRSGQGTALRNTMIKEGISRIIGEHGYLKSDSSIIPGVEIVTHPHTYKGLTTIDWESLTRFILRNGGRSHDAGCCGMHIHISRHQLGSNASPKIAALINGETWTKWLKFSRRAPRHMTEWAQKIRGFSMETAALPSAKITENHGINAVVNALKNKGGMHHISVAQSPKTIEIRIFRGTLNLDTIFATIQSVHLLLRYIHPRSISYLMKNNWEELKSLAKERPGQYSYFLNYCKKRSI